MCPSASPRPPCATRGLRRDRVTHVLGRWVGSVLLSLAWLSTGCAAPSDEAPVVTAQPGEAGWPAWLRQRVAEHLRQPVSNPPREIWAGVHAGHSVYYEPPVCCDRPSTLYSAQGQRLCQPGGGLTGRGDGRCPDADLAALQQRLVWRDPRAAK